VLRLLVIADSRVLVDALCTLFEETHAVALTSLLTAKVRRSSLVLGGTLPDAALVAVGSGQLHFVLAVLRNTLPSTRVYAMAMDARRDLPKATSAALDAVVWLPTSTSLAHLRHVVLSGCPRASGPAITGPVQVWGRKESGMALLTLREWEVLRLIAAGCGNRDIASMLSIELSTTKNHVHHILEKLGARSRGQAVALLHAQNPVH